MYIEVQFRLSRNMFQKATGDFPTVLYEVISKRSSVTGGTLGVQGLNNMLDQLSKDMGKQ